MRPNGTFPLQNALAVARLLTLPEAQLVSDLCLSTQPLKFFGQALLQNISKAKEIPINIRGRPGPQPLRGAVFPRGLPNLALEST
jgi:hypothetical protein